MVVVTFQWCADSEVRRGEGRKVLSLRAVSKEFADQYTRGYLTYHWFHLLEPSLRVEQPNRIARDKSSKRIAYHAQLFDVLAFAC